VDLDAPPRERWNHVLDEYKETLIPRIAEMARFYLVGHFMAKFLPRRSFVPNRLRNPVFGIISRLVHFLPNEYAEELKGDN
jgi:hypothetical protein